MPIYMTGSFGTGASIVEDNMGVSKKEVDPEFVVDAVRDR
jgi:hypothetical protein